MCLGEENGQQCPAPKRQAGRAGERFYPEQAVVPVRHQAPPRHRQASHSGQKRRNNQVPVHILIVVYSC